MLHLALSVILLFSCVDILLINTLMDGMTIINFRMSQLLKISCNIMPASCVVAPDAFLVPMDWLLERTNGRHVSW